MNKKLILCLELFIVILFVRGMFEVGADKALFWAMPAGYGAGLILIKFYSIFFKERKDIKVFDSRSDDMPPEVKEKLDEAMKILEEKGIISQDKCDNPDCISCRDE